MTGFIAWISHYFYAISFQSTDRMNSEAAYFQALAEHKQLKALEVRIQNIDLVLGFMEG